MQYPKPPLSFEQQLALLEERGLAIGDRNAAAHALARVSYYRFSAYWHPFKNADDSFKPGANFEAALSLYELDRHLRLQVMDAVERVEIALRTSITYTLAHAYGAFAHGNAANFRPHFPHRRWVSKIEDEAQRSKEVFIQHYKAKYEGFPALPIWMATEVIPLGALSRLYEGMFAKDQRLVAADYGIHHSVFCSWLRTLCYIRNLCAHHSRLWNREIPVAPELPRHDPLWNPPITPTNRRLFAVLLVLRQLMAHHHQGRHWQQRVTELLGPVATEERWRIAMGLPPDWQAHALWNPKPEA